MLKHFFTAAAAAGAARLSDGTHDFVTGAQPKREATEGFKHAPACFSNGGGSQNFGPALPAQALEALRPAAVFLA